MFPHESAFSRCSIYLQDVWTKIRAQQPACKAQAEVCKESTEARQLTLTEVTSLQRLLILTLTLMLPQSEQLQDATLNSQTKPKCKCIRCNAMLHRTLRQNKWKFIRRNI